MSKVPDAYSYIRFSSYKQAVGDSLRRQMKAAYKYAADKGLALREEFTFRDLGVSAYDRTNVEKGALSLFLRAVEEGRIKKGSFLLVENLDRLTRQTTYKAVALLGQLVEAGITVVTLSDKVAYTADSLGDDRELFYSVMLLSRGHGESKRKSEMITEAYEGRRAAGAKIICNVAPGWLVKDRAAKRWVLDPAKSDSVRRVFEAYLANTSAHSICQTANAEGWVVPSMRKDSTGWHVSLVRRILKNHAVTGRYIERSQREHVDFFPRVISDAQFASAQVLADKKATFPRRRDFSRFNVFQGLIFCGYCGSTLGYRDHGKKSAGHGEARRYFCSAHVRGATTTCRVRPGARKTQLNLIRGIYTLIADSVSTDAEMAKLNSTYEGAKDLVDKLKERQDRILDQMEFSSDLPKDVIGPRLAAVTKELELANAALVAAIQRVEAATGQTLSFDSVEDAITDALAAIDEAPEDREKLRLTIQRYVDRVYLYGREGLAAVLLRGDEKPYHIIASDSGELIMLNANGKPTRVRLKLPDQTSQRPTTTS